MRILGFVFLVAAIWVGLDGSDGGLYSEEGILVCLIGMPVAGVLTAFGGGIGTVFRAVFTKRADDEALQLGIAAVERAKSFSVGGGAAGTLIGAVLIMANVNDLNMLGPGTSLTYSAVVWSVFMAYGICGPVASSLRQKLETKSA